MYLHIHDFTLALTLKLQVSKCNVKSYLFPIKTWMLAHCVHIAGPRP